MNLKELQKNWNEFGKTDPLWAIIVDPNKKNNKWQPEEFFKNGEKEIDAVMMYVRSVCSNIPNRRSLDFGCGVGRLTQALANYFDDVYGIDIAPSMIKLANRHNKHGKRCHYILNESNDLKIFENDSFDFIYSNIVLQHMVSDYSKNYIREFIRILAPKGIAIFQIPSERYSIISQNITHALPNSAFKANICIKDPPLKIEAGSQIGMFVKVKNIGDITWSALGDIDGKYQIRLGNHWLDNNGNIIINDDARSTLFSDIKPMDEDELHIIITAPQDTGNYILELDMVQEMVTWFKDKGSETERINVIVYRSINGIFSNLRIYGIKILDTVKKLYSKTPKMEMYGVKKDEILDLIIENGGRLIDVQKDGCAGKEWISYRYCITKKDKTNKYLDGSDLYLQN